MLIRIADVLHKPVIKLNLLLSLLLLLPISYLYNLYSCFNFIYLSNINKLLLSKYSPNFGIKRSNKKSDMHDKLKNVIDHQKDFYPTK